ncbi:MAG: hypothetical protein LUF33_01070 [Clostridiales bacterium]|nr:hypothetical protein [Clostridiales bacterium]
MPGFGGPGGPGGGMHGGPGGPGGGMRGGHMPPPPPPYGRYRLRSCCMPGCVMYVLGACAVVAGIVAGIIMNF